MTPTRIVILAKAPIAGFCKTRLIPALGAQGAARRAQHMMERTVRFAMDAQLGPIGLCVTPRRQAFDWEGLNLPDGLIWSEQGEGDLGARMGRAAQRVTADGEAILLIGTDGPGLDGSVMKSAAASLQDHDASLVPAVDGGYVLLGLKRSSPTLFDAMLWSTEVVAEETRQRLSRLGRRLSSLARLHDIDDPQDLAWLPDERQAGLPISTPATP